MYGHPFNNLVLLVKRTSHPHSTPPPPQKKNKQTNKQTKGRKKRLQVDMNSVNTRI